MPTTIDAAWLDAHRDSSDPYVGSGQPTRSRYGWLLGTPNETYTLATDCSSEQTAFVFGAANVTLDLNGHAVTFNDTAPPTVANQDFELGAIGSAPASWDLSAATDSTIALRANDCYLFGTKALDWTLGTTGAAQAITSQPIAGLVAGSRYCATVMPSPPAGTIYSGSSLKVEVLDAVTLQRPATWQIYDAPTVAQGETPIFVFTPSSANVSNGMVVRITFTGSAKRVYLDRVRVDPAFNAGVVASTASSSDGLAYGLGQLGVSSSSSSTAYQSLWVLAGLSATARGAVGSCSAPTITSTVGTGRIVQGQGRGSYCRGAVVSARGAHTVSNVRIEMNGDEGRALDMHAGNSYLSTDSRTVTGCTFHWPAPADGLDNFVHRRSGAPPTVDIHALTGIAAQASFSGNALENVPHVGIQAGQGTNVAGVYQLVHDNAITGYVRNTNGYLLSITSATKVYNNTVTDAPGGGGGKGLYIATTSSFSPTDIEAYGNTIDLHHLPNREYGVTEGARALRVRNLGGTGRLNQISIHDNAFIARAKVGTMTQAFGARFTIQNASHAADGCNLVLARNVFKGIVEGATDPGASYTGYGVSFEECEPGVGVTMTGDTFEGTDLGVRFAFSDSSTGSKVADVTIVAPTIVKTALGVAGRTFRSYQVGYAAPYDTVQNCRVYDPTYAGGATESISWAASTTSKEFLLGYTLTVQARDAVNNPVAGATVSLSDSTPAVVGSGTTDAAGNLALQVVARRIAGTTTPATTDYRPHALTVTKVGRPGSPVVASLTLSAPTTYAANLGGVAAGSQYLALATAAGTVLVLQS